MRLTFQSYRYIGIIFSNYDSAIAPTVNDDSTKGFEVGSEWCDSIGKKAYCCVDSTPGAAIWKETTSSSGGNVSTQAYSATNVSVDRSFDGSTETIDSLKNKLGTLISDLRAAGILQ